MLSKKCIQAVVISAFCMTSASLAHAYAFTSDYASAFIGREVNLQAPGHSLVALPGIAPGGATIYASDYYIDFNGLPTIDLTSSPGNLIETYSANFNVQYLDSLGNPAIIPAGFPNAGQQGESSLTGTFSVEYLNRTSQSETGTFYVQLLEATFFGTTNLGLGLEVGLDNSTMALIKISTTGNPSLPPYNIDYQETVVAAAYWVNKCIYNISVSCSVDGPTYHIPALYDANAGPVPAPEPTTLLLFLIGVPGIFRISSRRLG
jgi:hypothetical protein